MTLRVPVDVNVGSLRDWGRKVANAVNRLANNPAGGTLADGDYGDITVSSSGTALTVDNDAITYAKIQNVSATSRFLGRITAGAGDIEELTAANAKTILSLAQADISGLTTADSPQFTGINLGHASDTTLTRVSAGVVAVEGVNVVTTAGGVTFAADISVPDEAYDATNWNGSAEVPTKNAIRDKIETLGSPARVLIAETVTSGTATNVQFASIVGSYRDLEVRVRGRGSTAATLVNIRMRFNGDTGGNYDHNDHQLNNTATAGFTSMAQTSAILGNLAAGSATANYADFLMATVADYRGTTFQKAGHWKGSIRHSTTAASTFNEQGSFWWRNTAAITQIDIFPTAGGFVDGTVVSLYGLM